MIRMKSISLEGNPSFCQARFKHEIDDKLNKLQDRSRKSITTQRKTACQQCREKQVTNFEYQPELQDNQKLCPTPTNQPQSLSLRHHHTYTNIKRLQEMPQHLRESQSQIASTRLSRKRVEGVKLFCDATTVSLQSCLQTVVLSSKAFFVYCFFICFLFQNVSAHSITRQLSDNATKLTFSSQTNNGHQIILERNIRSALTPPVKQDKTTPTKREISAFISNSHREPQRLATKQGFYVEIKKNGKVKGTRKQNAYSVFELISIQTGIIAIRSKKTGRFLSMDKNGKIKGSKTYSADCNFHESLIENHFFVFYKQVTDKVGRYRSYTRQLYLGFDGKGRPKKGRKVHRNDSAAHFQKLKAVYPAKKKKRTKTKKKNKTKPTKSKKP